MKTLYDMIKQQKDVTLRQLFMDYYVTDVEVWTDIFIDLTGSYFMAMEAMPETVSGGKHYMTFTVQASMPVAGPPFYPRYFRPDGVLPYSYTDYFTRYCEIYDFTKPSKNPPS